jgi:predicted DNA-binding protein
MKLKLQEKQVRKSFRINLSTWKKIEALAKLDHRTTSDYVRLLLMKHVSE